ncbi:MAG: sulfurtransferase [Bacteroidetes bacterium]|nr:MAG: sulfurtransferase [Bacteroidota bacterium]
MGIVSVDWLIEHQHDKNLIILDASLPAKVGGEQAAFQGKCIPGARFFDLKSKFSDPSGEFPLSFPSNERFQHSSRKLGISQDSCLVVYDQHGIYSSPRVWWMFRIMGHREVYVLDGGLPEWVSRGNPIENVQKKEYETGDFTAKAQMQFVKTYEEVVRNTSTQEFTLIDARSEGRFKGIEKEPRPQLKSGCIPGSVNIPYNDVLREGKYKSVEELRQLFESKLKHEKPLAFSCGSGLTACIVLLAYELAFQRVFAVYDGSWTEWATRQGLLEN